MHDSFGNLGGTSALSLVFSVVVACGTNEVAPSEPDRVSGGGAIAGNDSTGKAGVGGGGVNGGSGTSTGHVGGAAVNTGGTASGGRSAGEGGTTAMGGVNVGGRTVGGMSAGGRNVGGATAATLGGVTSGGEASGGKNTAGAMFAGGASAGGKASTGGASVGGASAIDKPCPSDGSPCRIMPFGDSITDGYGIAGGYRVELFRLARQAGKNITFVGTGWNGPAQVDGVSFPPNHEGHSGFTIDKTPSRSGIAPLVATVMPQFAPHIVLLMIGTNDAIDDYQLATAPARLGSLIDAIYAQLPNVSLVVAQPIPSRDDALNLRIQSYNAAIPAVVKARADAGKHILLVDMYSAVVANPNYKAVLLTDMWHPTVAGHALIGARWYGVVGPLL